MKIGKEHLVQTIVQINHDHSLVLMDHLGRVGNKLLRDYGLSRFTWTRKPSDLSLSDEEGRRQVGIGSSRTHILWNGVDDHDAFTKEAREIIKLVRDCSKDEDNSPEIRRIGVRNVFAIEIRSPKAFKDLVQEVYGSFFRDEARKAFDFPGEKPCDVGIVLDYEGDSHSCKLHSGPATADEIRVKYDQHGKEYDGVMILVDVDYFTTKGADSDIKMPSVKEMLKRGYAEAKRASKAIQVYLTGDKL